MEVSRAYYKPLSNSAGGEKMVSVRGINPWVITQPYCRLLRRTQARLRLQMRVSSSSIRAYRRAHCLRLKRGVQTENDNDDDDNDDDEYAASNQVVFDGHKFTAGLISGQPHMGSRSINSSIL